MVPWFLDMSFKLNSVESKFNWLPTVHEMALMYCNTTLCKGDKSLKDDLETVVVDPSEFMTVGDSLSRAVCEKSSLRFKSSKLS